MWSLIDVVTCTNTLGLGCETPQPFTHVTACDCFLLCYFVPQTYEPFGIFGVHNYL